MNKDKFLTELRAYLSILEKQEQEDILEEYAQHIDMKMQKGLSEEEAIRDFGPVKELAAEILEAYHVNPEFRRKGFSFKLPKLKTGVPRNPALVKANQGFAFSQNKDDSDMQGEESGIKQTGSSFKEIMTSVMHSVSKVFHVVRTKCRAFGGWLRKPFYGRRIKHGEEIEETEENAVPAERTKEMGGYIGRFFRAIGRGIVISWRWFIAFCIWCLKFMWNAAWLMFAFICAGMAMITLLGVGAIPVFLAQGYPFIGIFLMSLGGLLCFGALAYGAFSMLIRKKKSGGDGSGAKGLKDETVVECVIEEEDVEGAERYIKMTKEYDKEAAYEQTT